MNRRSILSFAVVAGLCASAATAQSEMTSKIRLECATPSTECASVAGQFDFGLNNGALDITRVSSPESLRFQTSSDINTPVFRVIGQSNSVANLFRLTNNGTGGIQFLLDRTTGQDWQFSNFGSSFQISVPGTPAQQIQIVVFADGHIRTGGDLFVGGDAATAIAHASQFQVSSSRTLKENIADVDGNEVLSRLADLPIGSWNYKTDPSRRHIGPMAEDFQVAFGLGMDGKFLSLSDLGGVTLKAVQALNERIEERDHLIADLNAMQAKLLERIEALERAATTVSGN